MEWTPLNKSELDKMIKHEIGLMDAEERRFWELVRVPPVKWAQHPWGDLGGGFWVVGIIGLKVIWYNDIEDGFNVSQYSTPGVIDNYYCNQVDLRDTIYMLLEVVRTGMLPGSFGPPEQL